MFVDGNWLGMREREETGGSQRAGSARTDMSVNVRTNSEREARADNFLSVRTFQSVNFATVFL